MPRRLSDVAWARFLSEVDVNKLNLAPWGGVIHWQGMYILVYICPQDGTLCRKGEVMLSDVSDSGDLIRNIPGAYDPDSGIWVYHVPAQLMGRIVEFSSQALETTGYIIERVAETAGKAAGAVTAPLLENLTVPLMVVGVLALAVYMPKR